MSDVISIAVIKVGAVVIRQVGDTFVVLTIRPQPKREGEVPPFVLPRGSRQYRDEVGSWHDARDMETALQRIDQLEPFTRTLLREIEEEAGVPPAMLRRAAVYEMGARDFTSRSKAPYAIHWFVVVLETAMLPKLRAVPSDAMAVRWEALREIEAMAKHGEFSPGYVPVIQEAMSAMSANSLPRITL